MDFYEEKTKIDELFVECYDNLETWEKVAVHNHYADAVGEPLIYENGEDFLNSMFATPYDAISAMGDYHHYDDYAWMDGLDNLNSADDEDGLPLADADDMADYYYHHPCYLKDFKAFNEWYDAEENGLEEDDEEEDDE